MSIETWLAFVLASSVMLLIPGPTILAVISYSITHGRAASVPLVIAVALGDATALTASLLGLGALLAVSASWFTVIKLLGGLYLIYLGISMIRGSRSPNEATPQQSTQPAATRNLFLRTYLVTALNPKGIVFFVAFLPQFVSADGDSTMQLWILALTFIVLASLNAALYTVFAGSARRLLKSPVAKQIFERVGGSLLAGAGVWTLLARRPSA